jgi:hypothetical protein
VGLQDFSDSFGGELVGLNLVGQMDYPNRNMRPELSGNASGGESASRVAIEHQDQTPEMAQQRAPLRVVQRGAHQRHHGGPSVPT